MIAYASCGLSKSERSYLTHKLEYLALKWAVCQKFNDYLYGSGYVVLTDNNPLTYVLTSVKLDAAGHRWLAALSTYNVSIEYRPGLANRDTDGLSRRPNGPPHEDVDFLEKKTIEGFKTRVLDHDSKPFLVCVSTILQILVQMSLSFILVESLSLNTTAIPDHFADPGQCTLPGMKMEDWCKC